MWEKIKINVGCTRCDSRLYLICETANPRTLKKYLIECSNPICGFHQPITEDEYITLRGEYEIKTKTPKLSTT